MAAPPPTPYDPGFNFTAHQASSPSAPAPGGALDAELYALRDTTDSLIAALADVRRADGMITAGAVAVSSLHPDVASLIDNGSFTFRGTWTTGVAYAAHDVAKHPTNGGTLLCAVNHTGGTLATDIAAVKWVYLCPFAPGVYAAVPAAAGGDSGKVLIATGADTYAWSSTAIVPLGGRQRLINSDFQENQRGFVSGASLGAGAYGHDRWKAGSGGCTYTYTTTWPTNAITITSGTLVQVIHGEGMEGGAFYLSWTGTAQARVNGGAYQASPILVSGLAAGVNVTVEFGTGTLVAPQFEPNVVTTYERIAPAVRRAACERFYRRMMVHLGGYSGAIGMSLIQTLSWPGMRTTPAASVVAAGTGVNSTSVALEQLSPTGGRLVCVAAASGGVSVTDRIYALDAEL